MNPGLHHLSTARTARFFSLGTPSDSLREVWFVCHGYGQLAQRFLRHFRGLDDGSRLVIAPEALSRFYVDNTAGFIGASWMTREDRDTEINDYVGYLDELYRHVFAETPRAAVRVTALGFSQGAAAVARWATRGTASLDRVVLWGEALPPELDRPEAVAPLQDVALTMVCGRTDEYVSPEQFAAHSERLRNLGLAFREVLFDGGHQIDRGVVEELAAAP